MALLAAVPQFRRAGDGVRGCLQAPLPRSPGTQPLPMVPGRSIQSFKQWLAAREQAWRDAVEVVAMDGFTGFKTAAAEELPDAVAVMDPFHVVRVRHEALCVRMGVRDLHRLVVAAAGLKLRAA